MPAWCNFISLDGKKVTDFKGQIPVEQVRNVVNWLSKKDRGHVV
jgi:thioredoxin-like negative regulator of GroEL